MIQLRALGNSFIPAGDSIMFTVIPDVTSAENTIVTYLNTTVVRSSTGIFLYTYDKYNNPTSAVTDVMAVQFVTGAVGCVTLGSVRDGFETVVIGDYPDATTLFQANFTRTMSTNQWRLDFIPFKVGRYTVNVTVNSLPLACPTESNLAFQVVPGPGWPPQSLITGPASSVAGNLVTYTIGIRDMWQNPIMKGSADPLTLDVSFGLQCGPPLAQYAACPASATTTWLSPLSSGPMYPSSGYPGCVVDTTTGFCPAVLKVSDFITDLGNSTYIVLILDIICLPPYLDA